MDELKRKVEELLRRHAEVRQKAAELRRQLEAKKVELVVLDQEIRAAVLDARQHKEPRDPDRQDLEMLSDSLEKELTELEQVLAAFNQE